MILLKAIEYFIALSRPLKDFVPNLEVDSFSQTSRGMNKAERLVYLICHSGFGAAPMFQDSRPDMCS